ncbi:hypothetical protein CROQUDRAFT_650489 [Cronartium quercuum f. sp. fusiforme G11]|uniref:Secreted protein n=1 Tax=Cronartium quercuum f. sp. fusiforme G11 TaxID=708437 RepID=A0A9P6NWX8_9BASI|nr:hypothetical protein CROQUDRAFT_650489 [Cronartium quercuum f. sp. fusiforme G11]
MHHLFLTLCAVFLCTTTILGAPSVPDPEVLPESTQARFALQGRLQMPADGDQFVNQGGAMGDMQLIYSWPTSLSKTNVQPEASSRTLAIDVILVPRREKGWNPGPHEVVLARGLRAKEGDLSQIQTNFVPPISTCGDYRLMVTENQILDNAVVQFTAGAPGVSVACSPLEYY